MDPEIRIVFTAGTHWVSRAIRWVLRSEVSHVFIDYPSAVWGGRWVAESTKGGVRKVPAIKARNHLHSEFVCRFDARSGFSAVSRYFGDEYDYVGAAVVGVLALLWRWFKVKVRNPLRSSRAQFCSELVARILIGSNVPGTERWDPEKAGPGRLLRFCLMNPEYFHQVRKP